MLLAKTENANLRDFKSTGCIIDSFSTYDNLNANMPLKAVSVRKETLLQGRTP